MSLDPHDGDSMTARRAVAVLLGEAAWAPPGVPADAWRRALAEDVVDLLAALAEVDVVIAGADRELAEAIRWPGMTVYEAARPVEVFAALAADGYRQGLVLAADAPDLPALLVGKLFRPLTSRPVAAAPALPGRDGLVGLATVLPAPDWLAALDPDLSVTLPDLRAAAPARPDIATCPGWHRLRTSADLAMLDEALEGWESTRALVAQR